MPAARKTQSGARQNRGLDGPSNSPGYVAPSFAPPGAAEGRSREGPERNDNPPGVSRGTESGLRPQDQSLPHATIPAAKPLDLPGGVGMFDPFFGGPTTRSIFLMANTKSALKNARKARRRMLRNKAVMTRLKTLRARLAAAEKSGDAAAAKSAAIAYVSAVDRAARQGVVHANAASHVKSHTAKLVFAK